MCRALYTPSSRQAISKKALGCLIAFFIMITPLFAFEEGSWERRYQECVEGDCVNGYGTMIYYSTQKYVGEFKDGRRHGQGKMIYPDGRIYTGEFKQGKRTGHGTMTYPDGRVISGWYLNGEYVGPDQK